MKLIKKYLAPFVFTCMLAMVAVVGLRGSVFAEEMVAQTISIDLDSEKYDYTGKEVKPVPIVKDQIGNTISEDYYSVTYENNKEIGLAKLTVTMLADYTGIYEKSFEIVPKGAKLSKLKAKRKAFTVEVKNIDKSKSAKKQISGYELQYSLSKYFENESTVDISTKSAGKTIDKLKANKTYYVRVRSYKKVKDVKFYSNWSKTESVKTCKYLVAIDAGHQSRANGGQEAVGPGSKSTKPKVAGGATGVATGLHEYELNLQVALALQTVLEERGYEVVMARTKNDVNITNIERANVANDAKADCFIRIHANGSTSSSVNGAQTICMTSKSPYNSKLYKKSKKLSSCVLNSYIKATGFKKEGVMERNDLSGTNWSKVPVTLIELGYMSNATEDKKMASAKFQKKMAKGIADGIDEYFK